jgi:dihydroorotate dehydrogenase (NAD+) catalytic subunit
LTLPVDAQSKASAAALDDPPDLAVCIGPLRLKNPVLTASGTFGYAREFENLVALDRLGGIIVKGLSLTPSRGNPPPRIAETPCGMLNAIGLENIGIDAFVSSKLPWLRRINTPVFVNIYGRTVAEYARLAEKIESVDGIDAIEVNISCPNVKAGGVAFGVDPQAAHRVVRAVRKRTSRPMIVKLSPNVTDIVAVARMAVEGGADALSLINTITGMAVDVDTRRPKLANITGGLSGPAIRPIAVRMVWEVARHLNIPIIGIGGIMSAHDALEFLIAGAVAVEVGTANFVDPCATMNIIDGIAAYLRRHRIARVVDIVKSIEA